MGPIFPRKFGRDVGKQGNLAHSYPSVPSKPGERGLNAAERDNAPPQGRGTAGPSPVRAQAPQLCHSASQDSDPRKQSAHAVPGIPIGAMLLAKTRGRLPGWHRLAAPTLGLGGHLRAHRTPHKVRHRGQDPVGKRCSSTWRPQLQPLLLQ